MLWRRLADTLFPDTCVLCACPLAERHPHLTCDPCWQALLQPLTSCPKCQAPLAAPVLHNCSRGPGLVLAPFPHADEARFLIHQLKYHHNLRAGCTLAAMLLSVLPWAYQQDARPQAICAVPLSYRAQWLRGFNQAEWLAARLCRPLDIPLARRLATRRHGPRQVERSRSQRLKLPARTFSIRQKAVPGHVAIVDDVYTTGATTRALRQSLLAAGAERVDIWCITRAI